MEILVKLSKEPPSLASGDSELLNRKLLSHIVPIASGFPRYKKCGTNRI